jgi:MscS family membrane protein
MAALLLLSGAISAFAADWHPLEPADTSSPRATLQSFIAACDEIYRLIREDDRQLGKDVKWSTAIDRLKDCLDTSGLPEYVRESGGMEAAVSLKEVLDRIELPPMEEIPDAEDFQGLDRQSDHWTIPKTEIAFSRIEEGRREGSYVFSPDTVVHAREFYESASHLPYLPGATEGLFKWYLTEPGSVWLAKVVHKLPSPLRKQIGGQAAWQWIGYVVCLVLMAVWMTVSYRLGRRYDRLGPEAGVVRYGLSTFFSVLAVLAPMWAEGVINDGLNITGDVLYATKFILNFVVLIATVGVILALCKRIAEIIITSPRINPAGLDAQFIRLLWRLFGFVAAVVVFLEGGKYLGIPLTTLLAGAGVGGLALALAAQDTLKNILGSMMILLDKPYRVGELIKAKGYTGVVEEIGLRSTKLRLLTGHQTSIPNEQMASSDVENIGRRPHIRRVGDLPLSLDISAEQAERAVGIVAAILDHHEGMAEGRPPRVMLSEFSRDALNLRFFYWFGPPDYWRFMAFGERVNKEILTQFEREGIRLALPASKVFVAKEAE